MSFRMILKVNEAELIVIQPNMIYIYDDDDTLKNEDLWVSIVLKILTDGMTTNFSIKKLKHLNKKSKPNMGSTLIFCYMFYL